MPYNDTYTTIMVSKKLGTELTELAKVVAEKEGLTKITRPALIERMIKVFKDTQSLK